jgi:hypothetical protein
MRGSPLAGERLAMAVVSSSVANRRSVCARTGGRRVAGIVGPRTARLRGRVISTGSTFGSAWSPQRRRGRRFCFGWPLARSRSAHGRPRRSLPRPVVYMVEVDRLGRRAHAPVTGSTMGGLGARPLDRRFIYRRCRADKMVGGRARRRRSTVEPIEPSVSSAAARRHGLRLSVRRT